MVDRKVGEPRRFEVLDRGAEVAGGCGGQSEGAVRGAEADHGQAAHHRQRGERLEQGVGLPRDVCLAEHVRGLTDREHRH